MQAEARIPSGGEWQAGDAEADGQVVVARRDACFGLQVKPSRGGAVTEIDYYPQGRNLTDVLSRRPEAYHQRREAGASGGGSIHELGKALPPEAERLFRYDWHPRWCGLDHFLHPDTTPAGFQSASYAEQGDFINQPYAWSIVRDRLFLSRKGMVWSGDRRAEMSVQKEIRPGVGEIQLLSTLTNLGDVEADILYGSEWSFYQIPEEFAVHAAGASLAGGRLRLSFEPAQDLWSFPLQTLSQSETGLRHHPPGLLPAPGLAFEASGHGVLHFPRPLEGVGRRLSPNPDDPEWFPRGKDAAPPKSAAIPSAAASS